MSWLVSLSDWTSVGNQFLSRCTLQQELNGNCKREGYDVKYVVQEEWKDYRG